MKWPNPSKNDKQRTIETARTKSNAADFPFSAGNSASPAVFSGLRGGGSSIRLFGILENTAMQDTTKKLSRPTQETMRAAALRDNLKKRKAAASARDKKDEGDDAQSSASK
jgi:hypothetical protein